MFQGEFRGPPPSFLGCRQAYKKIAAAPMLHTKDTQENKHTGKPAATSEQGLVHRGGRGERTLSQENHAHHLSANWRSVSRSTSLKWNQTETDHVLMNTLPSLLRRAMAPAGIGFSLGTTELISDASGCIERLTEIAALSPAPGPAV